MGFLELLTIIFIVLKGIDKIDWSWWVVLSPTIVSFSFYILRLALFGVTFGGLFKRFNKKFDDDDFNW